MNILDYIGISALVYVFIKFVIWIYDVEEKLAYIKWHSEYTDRQTATLFESVRKIEKLIKEE